MIRILAFSLASAIMFCSLPIASGETLSGSLTYTPSAPPDSEDGLWITGATWPDYTASMTWEVTNEDGTQPGFPWKYTYSFELTSGGTLQGGISHVIIECSEAMSKDDIVGVSGGAVLADNPVELQQVSSGNPDMPEDLWGIRFDPISNPVSEYEMTWFFWSNREPVWGDFYIKDGMNPVNIAYNYNKTGEDETGFLSSDVDPNLPRGTNPAGLYHILRPDSLIPEPGSFVLLVTAAVGLLGCAWRRKRRYG